tara:strand:+ start:625 stop:1182 length:558 start_codon:yes stop_codon:yes gene_type:complete
MKIGISINDIVRDLWSKIKVVHEKYYNSKIEGNLTETNALKKLNFTEDEFLNFLFEEAPMEIFGHSKEVGNNFIRALNEFIVNNPNFKISLISDEVGRGISSTYWFLAKYGSQIKDVKFIKQKEKSDIWDDFDVIVTNDKKIVKNKPNNKILISSRKFKGVDLKFKKPGDILNLEIFRKNEEVTT